MNGDTVMFAKDARVCHFIGSAIYLHDQVFICLVFSCRAYIYKDQLVAF